jgi:hypothetical protein
MEHLYLPLTLLASALAFWAGVACERHRWRVRVKDALAAMEAVKPKRKKS